MFHCMTKKNTTKSQIKRNYTQKKTNNKDIISRQEKIKERFIEEISKNSIKETACRKLNVPRSTIYRWMREDAEFSKNVKEATSIGNDIINDLAKSKLIEKINMGDSGMIKYHLSRRHHEYFFSLQIKDSEESRPGEISKERAEGINKRLQMWYDSFKDDEDDEDDDIDNSKILVRS